MKKILFILLPLLLLASAPAGAGDNPFFFGHRRQVALHFGGYGVDTGLVVPPPFRPVPFVIAHLQYSLPSDFFELPSRDSINIAGTIGFGKGYGWDWDKYSIPIAFLSKDFALLYGRDWYAGIGIGAGMQAKQNDRISSKLLFQFKILAGTRISEKFGLEVFALHMSNGNTSPDNHSYAWYGAGVTYSF
jgi:hypothetical protein